MSNSNEPDIGPKEPIDGLLTLTDEQFTNRYGPEQDADGSYYRQREWNDADWEELRTAVMQQRCWTMVEDDDGNPCLVWGNRTVNRLYNVITERPIENPYWEVQVPDDHEREEAE